ncbi:iron chelate uptake ABC transporter family permease subunit [Luteococcus sp. OSA5]|uniref:iron chelate uptake ABC transporter family permease subunit n=1 Tax=Luteococcus sp. OSA5 TaxID=3401630 RepID=UPI003B43C1FE
MSALPLPRTARRRVAVVALVAALLAGCALTLAVGQLGIPLARQPHALLDLLDGGGGLALRRLRGPRLATGLGTGAALGLAGALFQRATANPLVTPDVIGITAAAGAGTALATFWHLPVLPGSLAGALLAGLLVGWVTTTGFRNPGAVIVAGIGVAAGATAITQLVLVWSRQAEAMALASALTGSLNSRSCQDALLVWLVLLPGWLAALALRTDLDLVALGDEAAHGLGSRPGTTRALSLGLGIVLTAAAVAVAGPITFVALTAPHLARWFGGRPAMGTAALVGALEVCLADLAVAHWTVLDGLPVGVVTALLGGIFLGFLLLSQFRKGAL